jgi:tRNA(Ile)-lysidine synthase
MASSRKSSRSRAASSDLAARVAAQLKSIVRPSDRLVAGLSGGIDSVVLLDVLQHAVRGLRFRLSALHVNHQLSPRAGRWEAFCRRLCRGRGIPFRSIKVSVRRGDSLEAAARAARYAEFARQDCEYVVLAHHRDDQVETLLLQLLRGAGVRGLAAMPFLRNEGIVSSSLIPHPSSLRILRPLLDVTREEILEYAKRRRLRWVEDESNQDVTFQRNFIRHEVLPVIARRFPAYRVTLARAAGHLAEAAQLLDELAAVDAVGHLERGSLAVAALRRLPPARGRNLLRHFLAFHGVMMPSAERLAEALRQAVTAKQDARVRVELGAFTLRRHAGRLHLLRSSGAPSEFVAKRWRGEKRIALPELGGVLIMARTRGSGLSLARLGTRPVTIRLRAGGERLQLDPRRPRRSLKNLLQEARIPPWERERMPLIFCGNMLVWVPGIGVDCRYRAAGGEAAVRPVWNAGEAPAPR